jgi:transmembrane sensor
VAWLLRLSEATLGEQLRLHQDFVRWRDTNGRNAEAFARMERAWAATDVESNASELAPLVNEARAELSRLRRDLDRKKLRRNAIWSGSVAAAAAPLVVVGYLFWPPAIENYDTAVGETRTVQLADHSILQIDADSRVAIQLSPHLRRVNLLSGRAFFQVAHDRNRAFVVESHGRSVTATGTAFDVDTLPLGLRVTLVEGHVVVRAGLAGPVVAKLEPGDSLSSEAGAAPLLEHHSNLLAVLAWRSGRLVFDDEPLPKAINQMSHYVATKVAVDPSAAQLRISGVFVARDLGGLIAALERSDRVLTRRDADGTIHLSRGP